MVNVILEEYKQFYGIENIANVFQAEMVLEAYTDYIEKQLINHYNRSYDKIVSDKKVSEIIVKIVIYENVKKILKSMEEKETVFDDNYSQFSHSIGDQSFSFSNIISSFTLSSAHKKMLGIDGIVTRRIRL